jgi:hypothetical protein
MAEAFGMAGHVLVTAQVYERQLYVDSSRPVRANTGHSSSARRTGQIDPKRKFRLPAGWSVCVTRTCRVHSFLRQPGLAQTVNGGLQNRLSRRTPARRPRRIRRLLQAWIGSQYRSVMRRKPQQQRPGGRAPPSASVSRLAHQADAGDCALLFALPQNRTRTPTVGARLMW